MCYYRCAVVTLLRYTAWTSGILILWVSASGRCLAGSGKITGGIESAYVACLDARYCRNLARTQFRLQYKPVNVRGFSVRIRFLRGYQMTLDDDRDVGPGEQRTASKFDPPFDVIDVKLRFSESDGRDHWEVRTGYAYQYSDPKTVGYHTVYLSGDYYFGPPIPSGWGGLSRRWDLTAKLSQNRYARVSRSIEDLDQITSTYTVPLNSVGTTRLYTSYARELRFSGSNVVRSPSNRFELGAYRNPTRWLEFYGRISAYATRGLPGTARVVLGVDVTI